MHRIAARLIGVLSLPLALTAAAGAAEKVAVGTYSGIDYVLGYMAEDEGYFARHGLDVDEKVLTANMALATSALVGNSLQIAVTTVPVVLQADDNGLDIEIVAGLMATAPGFELASVLIRPDLDLKTAQDLQGRTLSVSALNSFSHILMRKWMIDRGADPSLVHFVEMPMAQFGDALDGHRIDGAIPVEPYLTRLKTTGQAKLFANFVDDLPAGIRPIIWAANGDYVRSHPEAIAGFRAGLADALVEYRTHPESADKALAHYIALPPDVLKNTPRPPMVTDVRPEHVAYWIDMMIQQKLLSRRIDPASVLAP